MESSHQRDSFRTSAGRSNYLGKELAELARDFCTNEPLNTVIVPATNPFRWVQKAVADGELRGEASSGTGKCRFCWKRIPVIGFRCRCGGVFCRLHRYPEEHSCKFDYKLAGRIALASQNLVCKTDKLQARV